MLPPETNTEHGTRKASLNKELVSKLVTKVGTRNTAVAPIGHRKNFAVSHSVPTFFVMLHPLET